MSDEHIQDDEISLLDLALTVAENLRLLIIGPIAAGLIALGVSSLLPKTFESVAILNVIDQPEKVASLATSAAVLDPVLADTRRRRGSGVLRTAESDPFEGGPTPGGRAARVVTD